jgi:hypothetical protein
MEGGEKDKQSRDGQDEGPPPVKSQSVVQLEKIPEPVLEAERVYEEPGREAEKVPSAEAVPEPLPSLASSVEKDVEAEVARQLSVSPGRRGGPGPSTGTDLPNGSGLRNRRGLSNGSELSSGNGRPGLRNRKGFSNGAGLSNGNGLSNGDGFVNGRKGIVNGLVNGRKGMAIGRRPKNAALNGSLVDAEGVTNGRGMVNGEGITNGRRMAVAESPIARGRSAGWIIGAVVLAVVIASVVIFFSLTTTEKGIRVDGSFADWSGIPKLQDDVADQADPQINIVEYAMSVEGSYASFYLKTEGKAFGGSGNGIDSAYLFLDTDQDPSTGYPIDSAGAEYVLIADGYDGRVSACGLYKFQKDATRPSDDWNARSPVGSCRAGASGRELECQLSLQDIGVRGRARMNVLFYTKNSAGEEDFAALTGTEKAALRVAWSRTGPASVQPGASGVEMLRAELGAVGGNVTATSLTVHAAGALQDAEVVRIAIFSSTGLELPGSGSAISGGTARLELVPPLEVPASGTTVLSVMLWLAPGAGAGKAIGLGIDSPADVAASTRTVSLDVRSGEMTYLGAAAGPIRIDGAFTDWAAYPGHPDPLGDVSDPNVDVTDFKLANDSSSLYFCVNVHGEMMGGAGIPELKIRPSGAQGGGGGPVALPILVGEDALFVFMDTDSRADTGYSGGGLPLGADFMVNITGRGGRITSQRLHSFTGGADRASWSWSQGTNILAATDLTQLEGGLPLAGLGFPTQEIAVFYYMTDWKQKRDTGEKISYDMRTQGGRGSQNGGTAEYEVGSDSGEDGRDGPALHAPEFGDIILPLAGLIVVFTILRRTKKRAF